MKCTNITTIAVLVLLVLFLAPMRVEAAVADANSTGLGSNCEGSVNPNDGVIKVATTLVGAVGCKCGYFTTDITSEEGTDITSPIKVKCPSALVCTTNRYNGSGSSVCLLRIGQACGNMPATFLDKAADAPCEGGTICDVNSKTCVVDTGDTTLSGALGSTTTDLRDTVRRFINIGLGFLGVLTVLMVIYGGFLWLTAAGEEEKVTKGKQVLTWAVIGAIVISIAWTISSYVLQIGRTVG